MKLYIFLFITIVIIIIFTSLRCNCRENFYSPASDRYNKLNMHYLTPIQKTSLNTCKKYYNIEDYPVNAAQLPWYKSWGLSNNEQFMCFVDEHLNRKCTWVCPSKQKKMDNTCKDKDNYL